MLVVLLVERYRRVILSKYILIDLEDTITIHTEKNRIENVMLKWLEFNKVSNHFEIYHNPKYKNRNTRLELLGIDIQEYGRWYENFNDVEFSEYYSKYKEGKININKDTISFIKKCKYPLILISNSSPKWIDYILSEYGLTNYFVYIFHREYKLDDVKKPNTKVINIIEQQIKDNISNNSIVVGDSYTDYSFAKNCGLNFIGMYNNFDNCKACQNFDELLYTINNNVENI